MTYSPMKYEDIDLADLPRYVADDAWAMEQKLDGMRVVAVVEGGTARFVGHEGRPVAQPAVLLRLPAIEQELALLPRDGEWALDGEVMDDGTYWLFDLLAFAGNDLHGVALHDRRAMLERVADAMQGWTLVRIAPQARGQWEKAALASQVAESGGEGVMLKRLDSLYTRGGSRVRHTLKAKYVKTADLVVVARNTRGHNNADLAAYRDGTLVPVGACSMNGKPDAKVGDVVEVRYLYLAKGDRLYQPTLLRIRNDKRPEDCGFDQLRATSREVVSPDASAPAKPLPTAPATKLRKGPPQDVMAGRARAKKVEAIVEAMRRMGVDAAPADPKERRRIEAEAGTRKGSDDTWAAVAVALAKEAS